MAFEIRFIHLLFHCLSALQFKSFRKQLRQIQKSIFVKLRAFMVFSPVPNLILQCDRNSADLIMIQNFNENDWQSDKINIYRNTGIFLKSISIWMSIKMCVLIFSFATFTSTTSSYVKNIDWQRSALNSRESPFFSFQMSGSIIMQQKQRFYPIQIQLFNPSKASTYTKRRIPVNVMLT